MVLVSKAAFVSRLDIESLVPLAYSLSSDITGDRAECSDDPLRNWFQADTAGGLRRLEERVNRTFVSHDKYCDLSQASALDAISPLAAFFYVAIFRVARRLTTGFVASNPTWIRTAKDDRSKINRDLESLLSMFVEEARALTASLKSSPLHDPEAEIPTLLLSNTERLRIATNSVDAIITSPPYCTRIDYAVATYVELAVLRIGGEQFSELRRSLTGSSTVPKENMEISSDWGVTCTNFLEAVRNHQSVASKTYYFKSHAQYFRSLFNSLKEIKRVLKQGAPCILVVQNSYYKDIRNDVAQITREMSSNLGLTHIAHADFSATRTMVDRNGRSKKYLGKRSTIETVLALKNI